jgi:hypothetical protein
MSTTGNNDAHKMLPVLDSWLWNAKQGGRTSQEGWTCQTKIKLKTNTGLTEEGDTTIESATTRGTITKSSSSRANRSTRLMNFHNYQGQDYKAISCGHQGGRISSSSQRYHDSEGIMALRRPTTTSTTDLQPLKRQILSYKVRYIIIYNGR